MMAYVGTNGVSYNVPVTIGAAETLYAWKNALLQAGWTVLATSNGTTLVTVGLPGSDNLTTIGSWNAAGAWCRLREPGGAGNREFILMRGSTTTSALIKYSRSTGFTSGAVSATQCPTTGVGGDGIVWLGVGTDTTATGPAAPSAQNTVIAQTSGYVSFIASDAASANGVWAFWGFNYSAGTGSVFRFIVNEPVAPASTIAASPPPGDNDPSWRYITNNMFGYDASQTPQFWQAYGLSGAVYITTSIGLPRYHYLDTAYAASLSTYPAGTPSSLNPCNNQIGLYPLLVSSAPPASPKGYTSGVQCASGLINVLDTINITSAEPRIALQSGFPSGSGWLLMPWIPNAKPLY